MWDHPLGLYNIESCQSEVSWERVGHSLLVSQDRRSRPLSRNSQDQINHNTNECDYEPTVVSGQCQSDSQDYKEDGP